MGLESATYVDQLNGSNPDGTDTIAQGDDHLRLIKTVLKTTFPDATNIRSTAPDVSASDALKILKVNSGGTATEWVASAASPLTTKGDIYTYSTADARLAAPTTTPAGTDVYDVTGAGNGLKLVSDSASTEGVKWVTCNPVFQMEGFDETVTSNTFEIMPFDTVVFDTHDVCIKSTSAGTASNRFTPTMPGYYWLWARATASPDSSGEGIGVAIYKDGSVEPQSTSQVAFKTYAMSDAGVGCGTIVYSNGSNYFQAFMRAIDDDIAFGHFEFSGGWIG
jgi:hypothetical protein